MICPLTLNNQVKGRLLFKLVPQDCLKEECAWWNPDFHECRVSSIEVSLRNLATAINNITKYMPFKATL